MIETMEKEEVIHFQKSKNSVKINNVEYVVNVRDEEVKIFKSVKVYF